MTTTAQRLRSAKRARLGFAIALLVVPLALFLLFNRQTRRLEGLASHGRAVSAEVVRVSRDGAHVHYAYHVDGVAHSWEVAQREWHLPLDGSFQAMYLPEAPSFSRPTTDASVVRREHEAQRSFALKAVIVAGLILTIITLLAHRDVRRAEANVPLEINDPVAYARRIKITMMILLACVALIGTWHARDALARGESVVPGILGAVLSSGIVVGTFYYAAGEGPAKAQERASKIMRWVVPASVAVAVLNLLIALLASR